MGCRGLGYLSRRLPRLALPAPRASVRCVGRSQSALGHHPRRNRRGTLNGGLLGSRPTGSPCQPFPKRRCCRTERSRGTSRTAPKEIIAAACHAELASTRTKMRSVCSEENQGLL